MRNSQLYEHDFYAWANEQASLLRTGRLSEADIGHIAEEIESMGRTEKRELASRLAVLLLHLLKWQFQPGLRSKSRRNTIRVQRIGLASHMQDTPSLKAVFDETVVESYRIARLLAESETGLSEETFPSARKWSFEQLIAGDFWSGDECTAGRLQNCSGLGELRPNCCISPFTAYPPRFQKGKRASARRHPTTSASPAIRRSALSRRLLTLRHASTKIDRCGSPHDTATRSQNCPYNDATRYG